MNKDQYIESLRKLNLKVYLFGELVDDDASRAALMAERLRYIQSNGTIPLRSAIAAISISVPRGPC